MWPLLWLAPMLRLLRYVTRQISRVRVRACRLPHRRLVVIVPSRTASFM
jgi:hypothetical protein